MKRDEIPMTVIKDFGEFEVDTSNKWKKRLKLISWNGNEPKYDIRDWCPNNEKYGKGITLTSDELFELASKIDEILE